MTTEEIERFIGLLFGEGACWVWSSDVSKDGYPRMWWRGRAGQSAHRVSYEFFRGPVPPGYQLHHVCENRPCVNPEHLEPLTAADHNRLKASPPSCPVGHPYDNVNTLTLKTKTGTKRACRLCRKAYMAEYYKRPSVLARPRNTGEPCKCGCGEMPKWGEWRPGHNNRKRGT